MGYPFQDGGYKNILFGRYIIFLAEGQQCEWKHIFQKSQTGKQTSAELHLYPPRACLNTQN